MVIILFYLLDHLEMHICLCQCLNLFLKDYFQNLMIRQKESLIYRKFPQHLSFLAQTTLCNLKNYGLIFILFKVVQNNQNFHLEFVVFNIVRIIQDEINIILKVTLAAHFLSRQAYQYLLLSSFTIVILAVQFISYYLNFINCFELISSCKLNLM